MSLKTEPSITSSLETRDLLKAGVTTSSILSIGKTHVLLKTEATLRAHKSISSGDADMASFKELARSGEKIEGRIRIDILRDDMFRIRYAEGKRIPENATEMVVGDPGGPKRCVIEKILGAGEVGFAAQPGKKQQQVVIRTRCAKLTIQLDPYRVTLHDARGRRITGWSGPEKNFFSVFDSYNTGTARRLDGKGTLATENFDLAPGEAVYGLGEQFNGLNKRGQAIELNMKDALGVLSPRSYKNIPFYVSTQGYGVFFNHSSIMKFWIGSLSAVDVQVAAEDDFLDYTVFIGDIPTVLSAYTDLTGKGALPPAWTFGYWQSKISYKSAEETLDIARNLRKHEVPCDVIHLDTHWFSKDWLCDLKFAPDRFPAPETFLRELADMGFKVSLWQIPYIPEGSELFDDLLAVDGFVKTANGDIHPGGFCFTEGFKGRVGIIDYSNPKAVAVHQTYLRRLFDLGVKVIKTDFGEAAPVDGVYHNGLPGRQNHNLYPLLYNRAVAAVTREATGDGVVWARSAWAGCQRYPLHWGGDNSPNYFNLLPQLAGGLSFGLSGFQFWSQDIGGFMGTTDDALLIRWMQLGMFLSHSRIHGFGDRELYKFNRKTLTICRTYIQLRYRMMPYIYAQARKCVETSLPMARPLVVEFQDDPNVYHLADEYLFGDDLLVAPMLDDGTTRRVYLPAGTWTDFWTRKQWVGPCWIEVKAALDTIPLFIREGGLIPMGPVMNYADEKSIDTLTLLVAPLTKDGMRKLRIPINGQWVSCTYTARNGRHEIRMGRTDAVVKLDVAGRTRIKLVS